MDEHIQTDVMIVGAGIAGLLAAHTLAHQGLQVTVVERNAAAGGRLATLALGPGQADYGAQFFTVRTPQFREWVNRWQDAGLVYQWSMGWSSGSLGATPPDGYPRYAVRGGMQRLGEHLSEGLTVRTRARLVTVTQQDGGWLALDDKGRVYTSAALLLTPPVPLALQLLDTGLVSLSGADRAALDMIEYDSCLAGVFWINGEVRLPPPGAMQRPNAPISWLADNQRKGISPGATVITVHAGPSYSRDLWRLPDWEALVALESGLRLFKDPNTDIVEAHLERWTYAMPVVPHPEQYILAENLPPLAFAGDAFGSPRVEGAALSGLAAAEALAVALAAQQE